jgi:hypothetical protein
MFASEIVIIVVMLAAFGGVVLAAQDKYTVKVPNGLAFSEFRGTNSKLSRRSVGDLIR